MVLKSITNHPFRNWAGNQQKLVPHFFQPETEVEICFLVRQYEKVKVVGTGHSWSGIAMPEQVLLNLDKYQRVLELNREQQFVRVQAGIKLWQLNEYLDKENFALGNLGSITAQSLAGVISTATHGSGKEFQILASQVISFRLVKADGSVEELHHERNLAVFNTALVGLGALGIVSEITLRIVPAFRLREDFQNIAFEEMLPQLPALVDSCDHFKLWWFPHTEKAMLYHHHRTQAAVQTNRFQFWLLQKII